MTGAKGRKTTARNVLILEPDPALARTYAQCLQSRRYKVAVAATAQQAIFAADDLTPDVVILELQLTAHSGIEFLYEFRSYVDWQAVPAIILSHVPAAEFSANRRLLARLGAVDYCYKPQTSLQSLLHSVDNALLAGATGSLAGPA